VAVNSVSFLWNCFRTVSSNLKNKIRIHVFSCWPDVIRVRMTMNGNERRMRWLGHVEHTEKMVSACWILVWKRDWMRQLRRPRRRWKENIKADLKEIGCEDVKWTHLAQGRYQWSTVVNTNVWVRCSKQSFWTGRVTALRKLPGLYSNHCLELNCPPPPANSLL
jgi:hypothetical protein